MPKVVASQVCGISQISKPRSVTAATVSETPLTAIEPFCTT